MVITQEPTQSLAALHGPLAVASSIPREQQDVALSLVIPFNMVVLNIFAHCSPQRALSKEDYLRQTLFLHRSDPAFRIGIQVWTSRGQYQRFDLT
jgi:hypothetical protein